MPSRRIALIGERNEAFHAHRGIEASFDLFGKRSGRPVQFEWVRTDAFEKTSAEERLRTFTGIWCAPGSPYASTEGALRAIGHARLNGIPFLGTCGGFQHALMEYYSSVLKRRALHQELEPDAPSPLITKLGCSMAGVRAKVVAKPDSRYARLLGGPESEEEFNCNYGMSPRFEVDFAGTDLEFPARDESGQVRVFWHRSHPFFVGSLFQPERMALTGECHPLVHAFIEKT